MWADPRTCVLNYYVCCFCWDRKQCICCPVLCNKLPWNLAAQSNKRLLWHTVSVDQELEWISWEVWCGVSHEAAAVKLARAAATIWSLDWGCRFCFQDGPSGELVVGWKPRFLISRLPMGCWSGLRTWLWAFPSVSVPREWGRTETFCLSHGRHMLLFLQCLIRYRAALFRVEGNYTEKWIPGDGTTGAILEAGYHR